MARRVGKLSARAVATLTKPGRHGDGAGLYLSISKDGRKRWVYLYTRVGRLREMGLGGAPEVPLAEARQARDRAAAVLRSGGDPIGLRRAEKAASRGIPTFGGLADEVIAAKEAEWRNEKHREQWKMTLREYAAPLRNRPVNEIETDDVLSVLRPLWSTRPETAARLRGRIEHVLDAARAKGFREGPNPALWRGHLDKLLPKQSKIERGHHAAMPYADVPAFLANVRKRDAVAALAIEFTVLTAARMSRESMLLLCGRVPTDASGSLKAFSHRRSARLGQTGNSRVSVSYTAVTLDDIRRREHLRRLGICLGLAVQNRHKRGQSL